MVGANLHTTLPAPLTPNYYFEIFPRCHFFIFLGIMFIAIILNHLYISVSFNSAGIHVYQFNSNITIHSFHFFHAAFTNYVSDLILIHFVHSCA
jgi:hypothetical protein